VERSGSGCGAVIANDIGHDVHLDRPELVVKAIRDVSDAVKRHSNLKQ
jgi:hypothetical protein